MTTESQVVFDNWNAYVAKRDDVSMFISFDEGIVQTDPPEDLKLCARIMVPIKAPNAAGGPSPSESELLWEMEDQLVALLQDHGVRCRLVGRLTYDGLREIVFQLHDWESFRPPVGIWMMQHEDYDIDVAEHEGWEFFDQYIRPRIEDLIFMADRRVVNSLVENGSDPGKEHSLEYVFAGASGGLSQVTSALRERGYESVGEIDFASGQVVLTKRSTLDLTTIVDESIANQELAEQAGVDFNGWGAAVVS